MIHRTYICHISSLSKQALACAKVNKINSTGENRKDAYTEDRSHHDFREWFVNPVTSMVEESTFNGELIARLHEVLRPFLLRRMKKDVEKQLPKKTHHIVPCHLSRRQQFLYDEFIASSTTQSTLSGGSFFGIANVLMQLRKVCNHPDLFASRPIDSPFQMEPLVFHFPSLVDCALEPSIWSTADIPLF